VNYLKIELDAKCNEGYYLNVFTGKSIYNNENENEIKLYGYMDVIKQMKKDIFVKFVKMV
jgi:hypothetical protein